MIEYIIIFLIILSIILLPASIKLVSNDIKIIVVRRGKCHFISKSNGMFFIVPFLDSYIIIKNENFDEYMKNNFPTITCLKCGSDLIPYTSDICPYCGKKI